MKFGVVCRELHNSENYDEFIEEYGIEPVYNLQEYAVEKMQDFYEYTNGEGLPDVADGILSSIHDEYIVRNVLEEHGYFVFDTKYQAFKYIKAWFD